MPLVSKLGGISDVPQKPGMSKGRAIVEATVKREKKGITSTKTHTYLLSSLYRVYAYSSTGEITCVLCEDFEIQGRYGFWGACVGNKPRGERVDRKSTRLNSSHI